MVLALLKGLTCKRFVLKENLCLRSNDNHYSPFFFCSPLSPTHTLEEINAWAQLFVNMVITPKRENREKCFSWSLQTETSEINMLLQKVYEEYVCVSGNMPSTEAQPVRSSDSRAYSLLWNIRERFLEMTPRRNSKSRGNLVAFLHLEWKASKVTEVGEGTYFLHEYLVLLNAVKSHVPGFYSPWLANSSWSLL